MNLIGKKIKDLAVKLTRVRSRVGTEEEAQVAEEVYKYLEKLEYFKENPERLFYHDVEDDLGRKSVVAVLKGEQENSTDDTIVLLGHIDTVGIEDYGDLKEYATQPKILKEKLREKQLSEEVKKDLESGDWIFGRGLFDMKTGVAAHMILIEELSKKIDKLSGNIVFIAVPDEEGNSAGMLTVVDSLNEMKEKEEFDYIAAIDTDYTAPRYTGDDGRYIYVGTVGKLLPCFYVVGKETHVGEAYNGLDPNLLSSELMRQIDLNDELCDVADGETTLPPVSLSQKDLKTNYSVQIPHTANLYFNYATHSETPDQVLDKLSKKAEDAFDNVIKNLNQRYKSYCDKSNIPHQNLPWEPKVMTFEDLYEEVKSEMGEEIDKKIEALKENMDPNMDDRDYTLKIVEEVHKHYSCKDPMIILYFAPPYYPHIYVKGEDERENKLLNSVETAVNLAKKEDDESIEIRKFYPYISDMSYCAVAAKSEELNALTDNMPAWSSKYSLPIESIKALDVPVVNIGPLGKDAHKLTERVNIPYSYNIMPKLLFKTVEELLDSSFEVY